MSTPFESHLGGRAIEHSFTSRTDDRFRICAELWRTLAHPKRLQILEVLKDREANVSTIASELHLHAVSVSQELAPLRSAGLVTTRRDGKRIYYRLTSPKVQTVCELAAEVVRDLAAARASTVFEAGDEPSSRRRSMK